MSEEFKVTDMPTKGHRGSVHDSLLSALAELPAGKAIQIALGQKYVTLGNYRASLHSRASTRKMRVCVYKGPANTVFIWENRNDQP